MWNIDKSVVATKFSGKYRDLFVVSAKLWNNDYFHKVSINLSDLFSNFKVFNVMGDEINFSLKENSLEFEVNSEPVYVVLYKK